MQKSRYKRSKFGCLPGDIPKRYKIAMLESKSPIVVFPWQTISAYASKVYRKEHHKRAERRQRQSMKKEIEDQQNG